MPPMHMRMRHPSDVPHCGLILPCPSLHRCLQLRLLFHPRNRDGPRMLHRLSRLLVHRLLEHHPLSGPHLALDDGGVGRDDERLLLLVLVLLLLVFWLVGELAVGAEAGGFSAAGAPVALVEPDDDPDDPGDADYAPGDGTGEDGREGALAEAKECDGGGRECDCEE